MGDTASSDIRPFVATDIRTFTYWARHRGCVLLGDDDRDAAFGWSASSSAVAMLIAVFLQVCAPAALIAWLAIRPQTNRVGLVLQIAAAIAVFVAVATIGLWTIIPFWATYLLAAVLLLIVLRILARWPAAVVPKTTSARRTPQSPYSGRPIAMLIKGRFLVRNDPL